MKRVYLDSNIFIAFVKSEIGKPYRLFYQEVEDLLQAAPERFEFVLSDLALKEIEKHTRYTPPQTIELFNRKEIRTIFVQPTKADFLLGKEFLKQGIHWPDALHAAIAIGYSCEVLLTYNKKDFFPVQNRIQISEPNEL